jgi:hypothetical protein
MMTCVMQLCFFYCYTGYREVIRHGKNELAGNKGRVVVHCESIGVQNSSKAPFQVGKL